MLHIFMVATHGGLFGLPKESGINERLQPDRARIFLENYTFLQIFMYVTRELPGVALVNISTGQIFMGKGINQKKKNMMTT